MRKLAIADHVKTKTHQISILVPEEATNEQKCSARQHILLILL